MTRIALAQIAGGSLDRTGMLDAAGRMASEAAANEAALISFPEQFVTGWSPNLSPGAGEPLDGPLAAAFSQMAQEFGIAVAGSIVEAGGEGRPKNTVVVFGADGNLLAVYAKIHLFSPDGEDQSYTPGEHIATFTVSGVTFGLAVCYDLRFPELFRIYALAGVECMLVPAAWPCCRLRHWETLLSARALDNRYYVAGINAAARPGGAYCGGTLAANPDGTVIARGGTGNEILFAEIDPVTVHEARLSIPTLSDRRSDLYHRLLSKL